MLIKQLQNFLDLITSNDKYDLGVCESNLRAIAGTGTYRANVGKLRPDAYLSEVIKSGDQIVLENKNSSPRCRKCSNKASCLYSSVLYFPLKTPDGVQGVAYLMSKAPLYNNFDKQLKKMEKISSIVFELFMSTGMDLRWKLYTNTILELIDTPFMIINQNGDLDAISNSAKQVVCLKENNLVPISTKEKFSKYNKNIDLKLIRTTPYGGIYIVDNNNIKYIENKQHKIEIIGSSKELNDIIKKCLVISKTDSNVLLTGETGTGKELFARLIHTNSQRNAKNLVTVNCSSIPENLLESELFGYVNGAFTGANPNGKKGKFEIANGGTIFLDEIGDLPFHLQAKILRAIEYNSIDCLGSTKTTKIDVQVIAATNKNLNKMVIDGTFREDLFYRLNVMHIEIPPLRSRRDDIPLLVQHFKDIFTKKRNKILSINEDLLLKMKNYNWPGNIRELKNIIDYGVCFADGPTINIECMPDYFVKNVNCTSPKINCNPKKIDYLEKEAIILSLNKYGHSTDGKIKASQSIGISLASLYRKIKKYKIGLSEQ